MRLTQKKLERIYWDLSELEDAHLDWRADDIKMLNLTKLNIANLLFERYGLTIQDLSKRRIEKHMEKKK